MAVKQFTMHEDLSAPLAGTGPFPARFRIRKAPSRGFVASRKGPRKIDRGRNPFNFLNHLQEEIRSFPSQESFWKGNLVPTSFPAGSKRRSAKKVLASLHCLSNKASCMRAHVFIAAFLQETLPLHIHQRAQGIFLIEKISL